MLYSLPDHTSLNASLTEARRVETILGLCASPNGHQGLYERLAAESQIFHGWEMLPEQAEVHGLGPLLHIHLKSAEVEPPLSCKRALQGLYVRHRHANTLREKALCQILKAYKETGIQTLVLKGAALAYLVYPEPGLRPMRDIDLLVSESQAVNAQGILAELGYDISADSSNPITPQHHHLELARRFDAGMQVSVELHYRLFPKILYYPPLGFEDLVGMAIPFQVGDMTAYTLGYESMLWHIYRHACGPPLLSIPFKLIQMADLVGLLAKYHDKIDWSFVKSRYPMILRLPPLLHCLTPWPEATGSRDFFVGSRAFRAPGDDYQGWPRNRLSGIDGFLPILKATLFPGEWWVRLFYGVGGRASWLFYRWLRHPLHVLEWIGRDIIRGFQGYIRKER